MNPLPKGKMHTRAVQLSGGTVDVHSLTLSQSRIAAGLEGEAQMVAAIAFATGTDPKDVEEWLEDCPAGDATTATAPDRVRLDSANGRSIGPSREARQ